MIAEAVKDKKLVDAGTDKTGKRIATGANPVADIDYVVKSVGGPDMFSLIKRSIDITVIDYCIKGYDDRLFQKEEIGLFLRIIFCLPLLEDILYDM